MKKRMLLALLLALVLAAASGCSLIVKDPEVDKQTVVLEVDGRTFLKGEVQELVAQEIEYQSFLYSYQYGTGLDVNDPELVAFAQDAVLQSLVEQAVVERKLEEGGYTTLTEQEQAAAEANAQAQYDAYVQEVMDYYLADSDLTGDELRAAAEAEMVQQQYPTLSSLLESEKKSLADEKLYNQVTADVVVSEDALRAAYDARVETAKADYEYNIQYFDMDVNDGATIYYQPAGYRYVKHILLSYTEEDAAAIAELDRQLVLAQDELFNLQVGLEEGTLAMEDSEFDAAMQHAEAAVNDAAQQLDEAMSTAAANLAPRVKVVEDAIAAGEDFDALVEQYGEDPGMQAEPAKTRGYLVGAGSTDYVQPFVEGAMGLAVVGDVSRPVASSYGLHLIKYVADVEEGPVPYEDIEEAIRSDALKQAKDELYYSTVAAWAEEADVKKYPKRLAD